MAHAVHRKKQNPGRTLYNRRSLQTGVAMGNQLHRQWTAESNEGSYDGGILKDMRLTAPPPSPSPLGRRRSPAPGSAVVWGGAGGAEGGGKVGRTEGGRLGHKARQ